MVNGRSSAAKVPVEKAGGFASTETVRPREGVSPASSVGRGLRVHKNVSPSSTVGREAGLSSGPAKPENRRLSQEPQPGQTETEPRRETGKEAVHPPPQENRPPHLTTSFRGPAGGLGTHCCPHRPGTRSWEAWQGTPGVAWRADTPPRWKHPLAPDFWFSGRGRGGPERTEGAALQVTCAQVRGRTHDVASL